MSSSRPASVDLTSSSAGEPAKDIDKSYRKGYYGAGRANSDTDPHEATARTRRQDAQASNLPANSDRKYKLQADDADSQQEIEKNKHSWIGGGEEPNTGNGC